MQECEVISQVVDLLLLGNIGAIFKGKAEMGSRALGNRSIIADPRLVNGKDLVNNIKHREWYRPFAASFLLEEASNWVEMGKLKDSPWMLYAFPVKKTKGERIPAVIHVDNTCRIQTVSKSQGKYYDLIKYFFSKTGVPLILNTSLNLAGDPLVHTKTDAIKLLNDSSLDFIYFADEELIRKF